MGKQEAGRPPGLVGDHADKLAGIRRIHASRDERPSRQDRDPESPFASMLMPISRAMPSRLPFRRRRKS